MDVSYNVIIQNAFILRKLRLASFAHIIKIATMFTKVIVRDSKKVY